MKFELGHTYAFWIRKPSGGTPYFGIGKFIKVTAKGYNFLNEQNNKCLFRKHWYKWSKTNDFFIHKNLYIKRIS